MADGEEVTLDGRPLQALRVADLKAALEQRGLPKSGQKSALIKRLRGVRKKKKRARREEGGPGARVASRMRTPRRAGFFCGLLSNAGPWPWGAAACYACAGQ